MKDATRELDALAPRIPTVTIKVSGVSGVSDVSGVSVTLDGAPVPAAALGAKRPVDPGKHLIRAVAGPLASNQPDAQGGEARDPHARAQARCGRRAARGDADRHASTGRHPARHVASAGRGQAR